MHVDASKESDLMRPCDESLVLAEYWKILQKEMCVAEPCEMPSNVVAAIRTLLRVAERRYRKYGLPILSTRTFLKNRKRELPKSNQ